MASVSAALLLSSAEEARRAYAARDAITMMMFDAQRADCGAVRQRAKKMLIRSSARCTSACGSQKSLPC